MLLAQVVGPVWGTRHAEGLSGCKVLELRTHHGGSLCAVDTLGAGPGEWVLVAHGSRVRDLTVGKEVAEKDIIIAIVDGVDGLPALPSELPADFRENTRGGSTQHSPNTEPPGPAADRAGRLR